MERFRYDRSSKWLIDHHGDSILRIAGVDDVVSFKAVAPEVVQPRQLPDGLLEVRRRKRRVKDLFLLEIETYVDRETEQQIMDDLMMVYQAKRVVPEVVLLVLRPKGTMETRRESVLSSPSGATQIFARWPAVELWKVSANEMMKSHDPGIVPWATLMDTTEPKALLKDCRDVIDQYARPDEKRNLLAVSQVLGNLRYDKEWLQHFFGGEEAMIDSPLLNEFLEKHTSLRIQRNLLHLLASRFGEIPSDIAALLEPIRQDDRLDALTTLAGTCKNVDAFRKELTKKR